MTQDPWQSTRELINNLADSSPQDRDRKIHQALDDPALRRQVQTVVSQLVGRRRTPLTPSILVTVVALAAVLFLSVWLVETQKELERETKKAQSVAAFLVEMFEAPPAPSPSITVRDLLTQAENSLTSGAVVSDEEKKDEILRLIQSLRHSVEAATPTGDLAEADFEQPTAVEAAEDQN